MLRNIYPSGANVFLIDYKKECEQYHKKACSPLLNASNELWMVRTHEQSRMSEYASTAVVWNHLPYKGACSILIELYFYTFMRVDRDLFLSCFLYYFWDKMKCEIVKKILPKTLLSSNPAAEQGYCSNKFE